MRQIKHSLSLILLLFLCQFTITERAAYAAENKTSEIHAQRVDFANNFANIVLAIISDQKKSYDSRKENLERAFSKSVDIDWIAKFVIGRTWNAASEEQREKYTELYREFLTKTYVENFAENPDKRISGIKILTVNDGVDSNFTVATQMQLTNQDKLNVNYLVREKEGRYKVLDIAIENVSLINTHRAEFTTIATSRGLDGVIAKLNELVSGKSTIALSMK